MAEIIFKFDGKEDMPFSYTCNPETMDKIWKYALTFIKERI